MSGAPGRGYRVFRLAAQLVFALAVLAAAVSIAGRVTSVPLLAALAFAAGAALGSAAFTAFVLLGVIFPGKRP